MDSPQSPDQPMSSTSSSSSLRRRVPTVTRLRPTNDNKDADYQCPICMQIMREVHVTRCGHSFCHDCIYNTIISTQQCPKCTFTIPNVEFITPNFHLNELITKFKLKYDKPAFNTFASDDVENIDVDDDDDSDDDNTVNAAKSRLDSMKESLQNIISTESKKLSLTEINIMLDILNQRKLLLEAESQTAQYCLLHEFLKNLLKQKEAEHKNIGQEIQLIKNDLDRVTKMLNDVKEKCPTADEIEKTIRSSNAETDTNASDNANSQNVLILKNEMFNIIGNIDAAISGIDITDIPTKEFQAPKTIAHTYSGRKQRMMANFDDFAESYFNERNPDLFFKTGNKETKVDSSEPNTTETNTGGDDMTFLKKFRSNLNKFSKYNMLRQLATLNYSNDITFGSTIVSSIEFDKDCEYFAIAGVTKRIKIFDYYATLRDSIIDIQYPMNEMVCNSKISCIVYNSFFKEVLASSDYEGIVTIWDVATRTRTKVFQEHDKRCWSVDFNEVDTRLLASGSDDSRVKLWALNTPNSIATLEAKANVCCVKFNPYSSCHLAFGSADHCVHYYDLRNLKLPVCSFKGHKKAVSYVKFLNRHQIVSAGTDGHLKLWSTKKPPFCLRSFRGHINEKNFVGLATNNDYLACGSEDNSLCVYYKGLPKQLFNLKFETATQSHFYSSSSFHSSNFAEPERSSNSTSSNNDNNDFVSAVCWRKNSNVIIAGNSRGVIKILEIV